MILTQSTERFLRLGSKIFLSPKTNIAKNRPGFIVSYEEESVSVTIGIGKTHIAVLSMTLEAYKALTLGEPVTIVTTKEFQKNRL